MAAIQGVAHWRAESPLGRQEGKAALMADCIRHSGQLKSRDDFGQLLNERKLVGYAAEIGVLHGDFSAALLDKWKGRGLFLVDPWQKFLDPAYGPTGLSMTLDWKEVYRRCRERFEPYGSRIRFIRQSSERAAQIIPDGLDFVYIDGDHTYEHVLQDLRLWYAKLKPGGILAGHDIYTFHHPGVTAAVVTFGNEMGLVVDLVNGIAGVCADSYCLIKA
jgi:hypothetical protein